MEDSVCLTNWRAHKEEVIHAQKTVCALLHSFCRVPRSFPGECVSLFLTQELASQEREVEGFLLSFSSFQ